MENNYSEDILENGITRRAYNDGRVLYFRNGSMLVGEFNDFINSSDDSYSDFREEEVSEEVFTSTNGDVNADDSVVRENVINEMISKNIIDEDDPSLDIERVNNGGFVEEVKVIRKSTRQVPYDVIRRYNFNEREEELYHSGIDRNLNDEEVRKRIIDEMINRNIIMDDDPSITVDINDNGFVKDVVVKRREVESEPYYITREYENRESVNEVYRTSSTNLEASDEEVRESVINEMINNGLLLHDDPSFEIERREVDPSNEQIIVRRKTINRIPHDTISVYRDEEVARPFHTTIPSNDERSNDELKNAFIIFMKNRGNEIPDDAVIEVHRDNISGSYVDDVNVIVKTKQKNLYNVLDEVVFEDHLATEMYKTDEEKRQAVIDAMKSSKIDVSNINDFDIVFEGVDGLDDGLGEKVVVHKKKYVKRDDDIKIDNNKFKKNPESIKNPEPENKADSEIDDELDIEPEKKTPKRHAEAIIAGLTAGLDIRKNDAKRYNRSNIKVSKNFINDLRSGNYLYNVVHIVSGTVKAAASLIGKITGKIMLSKRAKESMGVLSARIHVLNDTDKETLFNEYRGGKLRADMNNSINSIILPELREFGMKKIVKINDEISNNYDNLFIKIGMIRAGDEKISQTDNEIDKSALQLERNKAIKSAADSVRQIMKLRSDADSLLSGGIHGLEEDFKAVSTKLNYVGMRFSKEHDFNNELQTELGEVETRLYTALENDADKNIIDEFINMEKLYNENTVIEKSIFGKRSVGEKYYSPLAEKLDYRDDPFIKDLFTTITVATAAVNVVNAYRVQQINNKMVSDHNKNIDTVNNANNMSIEQARNAGYTLTSKGEVITEGQKAMLQKDIINYANTLERKGLDMHNWKFGREYNATDVMHHDAFNSFGDNVVSKISNVQNQVATGTISNTEALRQITQISKDTQVDFNNVMNECSTVLNSYAQTHPQFDFHALQDAMNYVGAHPDAICNMNQASLDMVNLGESLSGLNASQVQALSVLPDSFVSTIVAASSATALAGRISTTMQQEMKKGKYGNSVVDKMDEYLDEYDNEIFSNSEKEEEYRENTR